MDTLIILYDKIRSERDFARERWFYFLRRRKLVMANHYYACMTAYSRMLYHVAKLIKNS